MAVAGIPIGLDSAPRGLGHSSPTQQPPLSAWHPERTARVEGCSPTCEQRRVHRGSFRLYAQERSLALPPQSSSVAPRHCCWQSSSVGDPCRGDFCRVSRR
jgi:hypothetical protein